MNNHIYRQTDKRWSSLAYPTASSSFGGNGCGACAVLHCIIEMSKYKNWMPTNIQPYMKQYAVSNQGTTWAGIPAAMKHYGLKNVKNVATMSDLWAECKKGNRVGVLLFGTTKGPDGTVWTLGGHYIAFVDYKYEKNQHWLYLKDSGDRKHDKWWSYEKSMKGDVRQVWVGTLPDGHVTSTNKYADSLKKTGYTGTLPTKTVGRSYGTKAEIKNWQKFLNWWYGFKLDVDGVFGNKSELATIEFQDAHGLSADGIAGSKTLAKAKNYLKKASSTTTTTTTKTTTTTTTAATQTTTAKFTKENVIDVSYVQSKAIDWAKVKAAGIHGTIIRCGYRGYESAKLMEDSMFMNHISGASKAGLKLGIYFFTEAVNAAEGKAEAQFAIKMLKKANVKLTYPIAIDTENINGSPTPRANSTVLSKAKRTEAIKAFCEEIKANGYEPMIYASTSWLNNQLDMSKLPYTVWVAQYNDSVTYKGKYAFWQYTSTAKVNGVTGVVDKSYCYVDYGVQAPAAASVKTATTLKSVDVIAQEVLDGKWGAGETRKKKLTEAGYNYEAVQAKVNELVAAKEVKPQLKSIDEVAQEVLDGKWGAGNTRKTKLVEAGYDYDKVQAKVNELVAAQLEAEAKKKAEEEAAKKAEEEAKKAEEEAKKKAEEEAEAKAKAEEEKLELIVAQMSAQYDTSTLTKIVEKLLSKLEELKQSTPSVEPQTEAPKHYEGTYPSLTLKKSTSQVITDSIKWAKWIAGDNSFHYGYTNSDKSINAHHNGCYFCGTNVTSGGRSKKGIVDYKKTYCCNPFTGASWAHGGGDQTALGLCQKGSSWDYHTGKGYDTSSKFKKLGHPAKSSLQPGDVLCRDTHVAQYIGNNQIVEAGAGDDNVRNSTKWNNSIRVKTLTDDNYKNFPRVYRYVGSVNTTSPILHGEVSYRVADLQRFLNWYFDGALGTIDGIFGDNTLKYVKTFQTARKIAVDGKVGENTIAEMKKTEK